MSEARRSIDAIQADLAALKRRYRRQRDALTLELKMAGVNICSDRRRVLDKRNATIIDMMAGTSQGKITARLQTVAQLNRVSYDTVRNIWYRHVRRWPSHVEAAVLSRGSGSSRGPGR